MPLEAPYVGEAIDALLRSIPGIVSGAPGGIYGDIAKRGTKGIYIVHAFDSSLDVTGLTTGHIMSQATYIVKAVGNGTGYFALATVAGLFDSALEGLGPIVVGGVRIGGMRRVSTIQMPETFENETWHHLGGRYRCVAF